MSENRWFIPGKASVLVGGQFGSEAKGLAAAYMAEANKEDLLEGVTRVISTTNAGAQAGHTTCYKNGRKFVCYHMPTTGVVLAKNGYDNCTIYINGGSIINLNLLQDEFDVLGIKNKALFIVHPHAAVITPDAVMKDANPYGPARIASTGKGVGSALANKIMRIKGSVIEDHSHPVMDNFGIGQLNVVGELMGKAAVIIEIPQGTGLSLHSSSFFPFTTSRECWVGQGMTDAGVPPNKLGKVCMVVRTFPIRVGNTPMGNSGPFYDDSIELSWEKDFPTIEPERTTVTKRVRRIATFSYKQYAHGLMFNQPDIVFLSFVNYLSSANELGQMVAKMQDVATKVGVMPTILYSWGPNVEDVGNFRQAMAWLKNRREPHIPPIPEAPQTLACTGDVQVPLPDSGYVYTSDVPGVPMALPDISPITGGSDG